MNYKTKKILLSVCLVLILALTLCISNWRSIVPENFIPVDPKCGDLHGPVWVDNSCWLDAGLISLFGPEKSRMYYYQFLSANEQDDQKLAKIKNRLRDMVDTMWDFDVNDGSMVKNESQDFRNTLKEIYQGSLFKNYREISGFVESGDLNYSHRFLSDLCFILGIPGLPLDSDIRSNSVTYLLPPPNYKNEKTQTYWKAFGQIKDWDKFTLDSKHPFVWYRNSFRQMTSIPNERYLETLEGTGYYDLTAIIILAFQHYSTYFRCGDKWFVYDGLMEDDPVKEINVSEFNSSLSRDNLYRSTGGGSILGYLEDIGDKEENDSSPDIDSFKKERIFDPRISWIAPNDVDYEGDSLCMYTLRDI